MPTNCNDIRNEHRLNHGGTAQRARQPLALQPDYVQVDEKTFADWIVFVRDYARFVQFFNNSNTPDGDWTTFWTANPAIVLANIAAAPLDDFRAASRQLFIELQKLEYQDGSPASNLHLQQHLNQLFDLFTNLCWQLDRHIRLLPEELIVKEVLRNRVNKLLSPALRQWVAWQKHAQASGLIANGQTTLSAELSNLRVLGGALVPTEDFYTAPVPATLFTDDWLPTGATDWATYLAAIPADATIFGTDPALAASVSFAVRHYFFTSVYEQFLQAFVLAVREAEKALQQLLFNWNKHEPHFALLLAFLRMLTKEQAYLNTLTDRHLRFYYERVLRLAFAPAKPHQAFLNIELAKQVDQFLLAAGTSFKAGKDATGQEIIFAATEDFVANQARVTALGSIFKAPDNIAEYLFGDPERPVYSTQDRNRYFAAPVSNSADGLGNEELTTIDGRWHPFGNKEVDPDANTWKVQMPPARVGFAVASNYLYLQQGTRTITLKFNGSGMNGLAGVKCRVSLTTAEGWYERLVTVALDPEDNRYGLQWTIAGDEPAILPYQVKIHEGHFKTAFPVLKVTLVHDYNEPFSYQAIKNLQASSLSLGVQVTGKRDMALSGSTGPLDASKPFHPFGPAPGDGAVFILGDKEVFQKASVISLRLTWKEKMDSSGYYTGTVSETASTKLSTLVSGAWSAASTKNILPTLGSTTVQLNAGNGNTISLATNSIIEPDFSANQPFQSQATSGFLRFSLSGDWGHAKYPLALAAYAKGNGTTPALPSPLYDPQLLAVELDYSATQEVTLNDPEDYAAATANFFHLHPFGEAEIPPTSGPTRLLPLLVPQYNTATPDGPVNTVGKDGGEWVIGVEGLRAPQVLSLLVQVAVGTADPLLAKPKPHLRWWYMRQNEWVPFAAGDVSDGTRELLQSGLVRLSIPADINEDNTLLPGGKAWLRATVSSAVDAVNQLVGVTAQGMAVEMVANENDPQLGASPLPAGTITKLRQAAGAVKKVVQPYATFGGRAQELPADFYTRTSERLRHKDRAITQWDYERLLLQEFPQLHKVKCLNHLRYESASPQPIYRELAPGHVTIVGIAAIQPSKTIDPLRPYVSLADLEAMAAFLKKRMSCQATLHVRNPVFEPVEVIFKVRLITGLDESFYEELLNEEIINFLSPWVGNSSVEIAFGGKVHKSVLINFIEERSYVDYVEDFVLNHTLDASQRNVEMVRPTKQVSILVSARKHDIEIITDSPADEWTEDCGCEPQRDATTNSTTIDNNQT